MSPGHKLLTIAFVFAVLAHYFKHGLQPFTIVLMCLVYLVAFTFLDAIDESEKFIAEQEALKRINKRMEGEINKHFDTDLRIDEKQEGYDSEQVKKELNDKYGKFGGSDKPDEKS